VRTDQIRLMVLDPGHFHAALVQRQMYPGVAPTVDVYAPLGPDLLAYLSRVAAFGAGRAEPTGWRLEVHAGPGFLERMVRERPGDAVIISGRNRGKIRSITTALDAGLHVLADKPWILHPGELPALESALATAAQRGLVAMDMMTERFEVTSLLQRELVHDPEVFGEFLPGDEESPGMCLESVHHVVKRVAGTVSPRPPWFFDTEQQGEGMNDVGTHLVDLAHWMLFPGQPADYRTEIAVIGALRWPMAISAEQLRLATGERELPGYLSRHLRRGMLDYYCNGLAAYTVREVHVSVKVTWEWEPGPAGGDLHYAACRGSLSRIEARQARDESTPGLYVRANRPRDRDRILSAVRHRVSALQPSYPGIAVAVTDEEIRIVVPPEHMVGHEPHFGQVTTRFLDCVRGTRELPNWEHPNLAATYYVTTRAAEISGRRKSAATAR
jgi:predicted dehydrogenase